MQRGSDDRRQSRSNVFLSAALVTDGRSVPVRVRNLSARGALLEGSAAGAGTKVQLLRGSLAAEGEIAWQRGRQAGIRFNGEIDVSEWIRRVEHPGQQSVDALVASVRSKAPRAAVPVHSETASLTDVVLELDSICERVAASASMSMELGEELVKLESIARTLDQIVRRE